MTERILPLLEFRKMCDPKSKQFNFGLASKHSRTVDQ
jgi:hypothetical protein